MSLPIEQMEWFLMSFFQNPRLRCLTTESNHRQIPLPSNPKRLLLKILYRFNTGYQLLTQSSAHGLCDWFLSLGLQRSQP